MKGASADPCANIRRPPTTSITNTIGKSHHFFRARMNPHISPSNPLLAITPPPQTILVLTPLSRRLLVLMDHIVCRSWFLLPRHPVGGRITRRTERLAAEQPEHEARGSNDDEVDDGEKERRRHLRDRVREAHPATLHRSHARRDHHPRQDECAAEAGEDGGGQLLVPPHRQPGEHDARRAHGERELAAFARRQSSWNSCCHAFFSSHLGCAVLSSRNGPSTK